MASRLSLAGLLKCLTRSNYMRIGQAQNYPNDIAPDPQKS